MRKHALIHGAWIIGILVSLLIGSISVEWASISELATIISFAVGLASLLLAVIAIFQSMTATPALAAALADINAAAQAVSHSTLQLGAATAHLIRQSEVVDALPTALDKMNSRLEMLTAPAQTSDAAPPKPLAKEKESYTPNTKRILEQATIGGVAALYLAARTNNASKRINSKLAFPENEALAGYANGFIAALASADIITVNNDDSQFLVTNLNGLDQKMLLSFIDKRIGELQKKGDDSAANFLVSAKSDVDTYTSGN